MSDYPYKAPASKNPFSSPKKKAAPKDLNRVRKLVESDPPKPKPIEKPKEPLPPLTMEEKTCRSCEFYAFDEKVRRHDAYKGECRRNAPIPKEGDSQARWPVVPWKTWCGEWENGVSNEDMVRMARDIGESLINTEEF